MVQFLKATWLMENLKVVEFWPMQIKKDMKDSFIMGWNTVKGNITILKANCISEIGFKIKSMAKGCISMRMETDTLESSKTIWSTAKVESIRKMAASMPANSSKTTKIKPDSILMQYKIKNSYKFMIKEAK